MEALVIAGVGIVVGIIGTWIARVAHKYRIPKLEKLLEVVDEMQVKDWIDIASKVEGMTAEERKQFVVNKIKEVVEKKLGEYVNTSLANLAVEFVYSKYFK